MGALCLSNALGCRSSIMPLRRRKSAAPNVSDPFFIAWKIMDGDREVKLIVGTDTLQDLAFHDGNDLVGAVALWELYRDELERVASATYAEEPSQEMLLRLGRIKGERALPG
jgi:hypothetical protein